MGFLITLSVAGITLFRHKMRSALTMLGLMIGIGAVICVVAIGTAGSEQLQNQLNNLGDNLVWVEAGGLSVNGVRTGTGGTKSLTVQDAEAIAKEIRLIKKVSPQVDGQVQVVYGNHNWFTRYTGESPEFLEIKKWEISQGTNFTDDDVDRAANVCVLGNTVKEQLFPDEDPIGKEIKVKALPCKVIGVILPKGFSAMGQDQDDFILIPYTMAQKKIAGITWLRDIMMSAISPEAVAPAREEIAAMLRERHRIRPGDPDDFNLRSPEDLIQARLDASKTMSLFLIAVASVSLLVGGIGIMNVMLVSVTERTREIGVRMAVGATEAQVQVQFLGESVILSLFGGMIGVLLGLGGSVVIGRMLEWPMSISLQGIVIAAAFSIAVGVFFGYYPARQAARLDPIQALRFE